MIGDDNLIILNREQLRMIVRDAVGEGISLTQMRWNNETPDDITRTVENVLTSYGLMPVVDVSDQ